MKKINSAFSLRRLAFLLLVLVAGLYFSRGFFQRLQKTYPPNAFYQVKRADMLIAITEEGALRALNETVVRSSLEGLNRVIYLAPEGSYVQKGDLLVELDSSGLKDRLNEQELLYQDRLFQMLQATGNLKIQKSLAESQIKDGELKVDNAQADLEKYRDGDAPLLIKTVEARSGVLAEQVRIASERSARTEELFKTGNATKSELEADALSLKREQLALSQYQEDLRLIKKFDQPNQVRLLRSNVEQAQAELQRLRQRLSNEIAQAEADLKTSQSALEVLDQSLDMQRRRLENAKIVAPQNGLVVYAAVSPFQFAFDREDRRRDEGRRGGGRGFGRGGEDGGGEFRGGGRRGGRSNLEGSGTGASTGDSSRSSTAETVAAGNQRIASAISGSSVTQPGTSSGGDARGEGATGAGSGSGSSSSGGGRAGGGTGGGQNASSAAGAFASYPSMRPSSAFGASSAATNQGSARATTAASSGSGAAGSNGGGGRAEGLNNANQFGSRSSSQSFRDFGGFDFFGAPGLLEEGAMVRQRQELIRLPDVSKMIAEVKIEETRAGQIRAGMTAYIQVKNIPHRRFKGTVRRVALLPDSQSSWMNPNAKLFPADILVDEELPILKPGVSASAEIVITNLTHVLSVPIQTVARLDGENVCFVKRGNRVTPVTVTTGWFNDAFVEVTSGLKDGDLVLLAPVSDEDMAPAPSEETNRVEAPVEPNGRPMPPGEGSPGEPRRFQRRNSDSPEGEAPSERRRNREGSGRRPQNSQDDPK